MIDLRKGDCLEVMKDIPDGSVDLILTDPPYGTMRGAKLDGWKNKTMDWDREIDTNKMFAEISRILRQNGKCVLFSQEPYTSRLIAEAIPSLPFCYRAIWYKNIHANALLAKTAMVSRYEDICVFNCTDGRNPIMQYIREEFVRSGMTRKGINSLLGSANTGGGMASHLLSGKSQNSIPTRKSYEKLQTTGYWQKNYDELVKKSISTFNLWQGNKSKSNVLEYAKDKEHFHPTQKPVLLLEDLIKTYSNKGDTVLDFTMGSGSTGVACVNTGRNFIGIELDEQYFNIAKERIKGASGN